MEKKLETAILYCGYIGIMENKMEATIQGPNHGIKYFLLWGQGLTRGGDSPSKMIMHITLDISTIIVISP